MISRTGSVPVYLQQLPLLLPVSAWVSGLALARSDAIALYPAAIILALLCLLLLALRCRVSALLLLLAVFWGTGDLLLDAGKVAVDDSWLAAPTACSARIQSIQHTPTFTRLLLSDVRRDNAVRLAGNALLYIYPGKSENDQPLLRAGNTIAFHARWHTPHNRRNPGAFDYSAWCFDHHIALLGSVRGHVQRLAHDSSVLQHGRERIERAIIGLPDAPAAILRALLLGDQAQLPVTVRTAFAATGTAHLLAISGMHVGMTAAWAMALLWWLLTRREAWIVNLPIRGLAMFGGLLAAMSYALIAGWPLPAVRATMMMAAAVLAWLLSERNAPMNILLAALALILLIDPTAITSLSLWLSFSATAALLLWAVRSRAANVQRAGWLRQRLITTITTLAWVSLIATLATLPITLAAFGRLPLYSIPANLLLVPLYALLVMPAALLAELAALFNLPDLAGGLMQLAGMAAEAGLHLLERMTSLPAGNLWAVHPPLWLGGLYMAGMLFAGRQALRKHKLQAALSALLVVGIYSGAVLHENSIDAPRWVVWDVGQGAASTLLLPGKRVVVVDLPGRTGSRFNGGTSVATGLRFLGFTHVDLLILSHAQSDHLGGALSLLHSVNNTGEIWLPDVPAAHKDARVLAIAEAARAQGTPVRWLARGDTRRLITGTAGKKSATQFDILWPPRGFAPNNENNTSLVVSVTMGGETELLWPGDIEASSERQLLKSGLPAVHAMLIPHHGSKTSSSPGFIGALAPDLAVAQVAAHNRYRFPAAGVLARYRAIGAQVATTADGAIIVGWHGSHPYTLQPEEQATSRRRLAHDWWQRLHAK